MFCVQQKRIRLETYGFLEKRKLKKSLSKLKNSVQVIGGWETNIRRIFARCGVSLLINSILKCIQHAAITHTVVGAFFAAHLELETSS